MADTYSPVILFKFSLFSSLFLHRRHFCRCCQYCNIFLHSRVDFGSSNATPAVHPVVLCCVWYTYAMLFHIIDFFLLAFSCRLLSEPRCGMCSAAIPLENGN